MSFATFACKGNHSFSITPKKISYKQTYCFEALKALITHPKQVPNESHHTILSIKFQIPVSVGEKFFLIPQTAIETSFRSKSRSFLRLWKYAIHIFLLGFNGFEKVIIGWWLLYPVSKSTFLRVVDTVSYQWRGNITQALFTCGSKCNGMVMERAAIGIGGGSINTNV